MPPAAAACDALLPIGPWHSHAVLAAAGETRLDWGPLATLRMLYLPVPHCLSLQMARPACSSDSACCAAARP